MAARGGNKKIEKQVLVCRDVIPNTVDIYDEKPLITASKNIYEIVVKMVLGHAYVNPTGEISRAKHHYMLPSHKTIKEL